MNPTQSDYNVFARKLSEEIASRATGSDDESVRIVNSYPSDHILTGFLTPLNPNKQSTISNNDKSDTLLTEDLPNDSSYEQTNVGMEWLMPVKSIGNNDLLDISISMSLYMRIFPTREEQLKHKSGIKFDTRTQESSTIMIPVWLKVTPDPFHISVSVNALAKGNISYDLSEDLNKKLNAIDRTFDDVQLFVYHDLEP